MEVVLERDSTEESWGLVWHVQGYKAQNLGFSTATCFFLVVVVYGDFFEVIWIICHIFTWAHHAL